MKIIIQTSGFQEVAGAGNEDAAVGQTHMHMEVTETGDLGRHADSAIVGTLLNAFMGTLEKFVEKHPCKDCTTYVAYNSMLRHLQVIQGEALKAVHVKEDGSLDS